MKQYWHILFFLLISFGTFANSDKSKPSINSLQKQIQEEQTEIKRIKLLLKLGYLYEDLNLDSSIICYQQSVQLALKLNHYALKVHRFG